MERPFDRSTESLTQSLRELNNPLKCGEFCFHNPLVTSETAFSGCPYGGDMGLLVSAEAKPDSSRDGRLLAGRASQPIPRHTLGGRTRLLQKVIQGRASN